MMRFRSLAKTALWALAFCILAPLAAAAQASDQPSVTEWAFRWLNFALVFGVGGYYLGRWMKGQYRLRAGEIAASISEAETAERQAEQRLRAAEAKLEAIAEESTAMRERARRDSAAESTRIRALAQEEVARLGRAADAEITAAERATVNALKELAIARTLEQARAAAARQMTPAVDGWLFRRFVDELASPVNPS
jgi:F0F1-type ATP synthase membrane subunit b/b'